MKYIYIMAVAIFCGAVFAAYWAGGRMAMQKCRADLATQNTQTITQIIKVKEQINAQTVNHGADDIRRVLRQKYTIVD